MQAASWGYQLVLIVSVAAFLACLVFVILGFTRGPLLRWLKIASFALVVLLLCILVGYFCQG